MSGHRPIVVGIDGSPSSLQAVSWAAREAALRATPLSLITTAFVPGTYGVPIGMPASFFQDEERDGQERLNRAAQAARDAVPGHNIEIVTTLCTGTPAGELLARSADASMLVSVPTDGESSNAPSWDRSVRRWLPTPHARWP